MTSIVGGTSGFTFPDGTTQTTAATTPTSVANLSGGSAGKIPFQTGANTTSFTAAGTTGQVLTSTGTGTPTWTTPSSGAMILISTKTGDSSSTMEWTGLSSYSSYVIIFRNIQPQSSSSGNQLCMAVGTGSTTYLSSGYAQAGMLVYANNTYTGLNSSGLPYFLICGAHAGINSNGTGGSGIITMSGFNSNYFSHQTNSFIQSTSPTLLETDNVSGAITSSNTTTAIKLQFADASVPASGTASLYGITS